MPGGAIVPAGGRQIAAASLAGTAAFYANQATGAMQLADKAGFNTQLVRHVTQVGADGAKNALGQLVSIGQHALQGYEGLSDRPKRDEFKMSKRSKSDSGKRSKSRPERDTTPRYSTRKKSAGRAPKPGIRKYFRPLTMKKKWGAPVKRRKRRSYSKSGW